MPTLAPLLALSASLVTIGSVDTGPLTPMQAAKREGDTVTVEFTVKSGGTNSGFAELYSEDSWRHPDCFFIRFPEAAQKKLKQQNVPDLFQHFTGQVVRVTGPVKSIPFSEGKRMVIYVEDLTQIELVEPKAAYTPTSDYQKRTMAEFTVLLHPELRKHPTEAAAAVRELKAQLNNIARVLPKEPLVELRKVRIWLEWDKRRNGAAEFHGSVEWLRQNGYNPDKAGGVELSSARNFVTWSRREQPWMVLHELAHAYHHQALDDDYAGITAAYGQAMERNLYESVDHVSGEKKKAYAATNAKEYFAELTEAYFGRNDFYPFTRLDLQKHDPVGYQLIQQAWAISGDPKR